MSKNIYSTSLIAFLTHRVFLCSFPVLQELIQIFLEWLKTALRPVDFFKNPSRAGGNLNKSAKVKVKVKFTLEQATKAQSWRRGIALLFLQPRR